MEGAKVGDDTSEDEIKFFHRRGFLCFNSRSDQSPQCKFLARDVEGFDKMYFEKMKISGKPWAFCWDNLLYINLKKQ